MASIWQVLGSLTAAGALMLGTAADTAAPQSADGDLLLGNRQWLLSESYYPEIRLANVQGQVKGLQPHVADALEAMFDAFHEQTGKRLVSVSGFREYDKQERIYNNKLRRVHGSVTRADEYVARPGASEHQTGLTMDIGMRGDSKSWLGQSFAGTAGGKWIREHAWEYGFILRYDKGWEDVTGYQYEPWHIRYVGLEAAAEIREQNIPLETWLIQHRGDVLLELVSE